MDRASDIASEHYTTGRLAAASGYSVQQVRDLERLGVIPPAVRGANGYRRFGPDQLLALRAYRRLALAVGPVSARGTMEQVRRLPYDEAVARVVALHVDLARARDDTLAALAALDSIVDEGVRAAAPTPADAMSIGELAAALGVRPSTLRFWEEQGLVTPERTPPRSARSYPVGAIRDARIVAALRAGGYGIPAVQAVMESIHALGNPDGARHALRERLRAIAARSDALIRAGTDIADLISRRQRTVVDEPPSRATPGESAPDEAARSDGVARGHDPLAERSARR